MLGRAEEMSEQVLGRAELRCQRSLIGSGRWRRVAVGTHPRIGQPSNKFENSNSRDTQK